MATAFPPIHIHATKRVSLSHAHTLLSSYLESAATDASLHPNALLTEDGPTNPSGAQMGLVLHNLQRVEAGLRGEYLGADLEIGKKNGGAEGGRDEAGEVYEDAMVVNPSEGKVGQVDAEVENEWQDRGEFEREQEDLAGEIGERGSGAPDRVKVPRVERGNKEERKRAKAERRKGEKREKEELRKKEKEAKH